MTTLRTLLFITFLACSALAVNADTGDSDFNKAGFATMTVIFSFVLLAATIWSTIANGSVRIVYRDFLPVLILNGILFFCGLMLLFAPGEPGPRANIVGFQLILGALLGQFAILTNHRPAYIAAFVFGIFNLLCLIGGIAILGYATGIWYVSTADCNSHFGSSDLDRCKTDGFLQFVRTCALFATFCLTGVVTIIFMDITGDSALGSPSKYAANNNPREPLMTSAVPNEHNSFGSYQTPQNQGGV